MSFNVEAVYEQGAFKPEKPLELPEGQKVTLTVSVAWNPNGAPQYTEIPKSWRIFEDMTDEEFEEVRTAILGDRVNFMKPAREDW